MSLYDIPLWRELLLCTLLILAKALKGVMHGHVYRRYGVRDRAHDLFRTKWLGIHETDYLFSLVLAAMCLLAGVDLIRVFGAGLVAMVPFQWFINLSVGRGMFDAGSSPTRWKAFGVEWIRPFSGKNLYRVGLPIGLLLMFYDVLINLL